MKYIKLLISLLLIVNCAQKSDNSDLDSRALTGVNEQQANMVIRYNNAFVDYFNESSDLIKSVSEEYIKMFLMANSDEVIEFQGNMFLKSQPDATKENNGVNLSLGTGLTPDLVKQITPEIIGANNAFIQAKTAYQQFSSYYKDDQYEDDQWQKGKELVDELELAIKSFYNHRELAHFIIKPLADQAELLLLENHPLKEPIDAAKGDLTIAENILLTLSEEVIDMDKIDEQCMRLKENIKTHKLAFQEVLKNHQKELNYSQYYLDMDNFREIVKINAEDGIFSIDEIKTIHQAHKKLVRGYNLFY